MGATSTREYCRECGKETLHKIIYRQQGFIIYKVCCPECKAALERIGNASDTPVPVG
jgi:hypothetical protein